jgi:CO/xanthine dehydrogenase FAD-binding subunit
LVPFKDLHWGRTLPVKRYLQPRNLEEALQVLTEFNGRAKIIAGGTDLLPQLRRGDLRVETLIDITRLPGMNQIEVIENDVCIGSLATHAQVCLSPLIRERVGLLADGAAHVGSPQIRNIATVAGNLVSGEPAADTAIPLLALNARVRIVSAQGEREVSLADFFLDRGETAVDPHKEILTQIRFTPLRKEQGGAYLRLSRRKTLSLPILVVSTVVTVHPASNRIKEAAIAIGPVAPTPFRARDAESKLAGRLINDETLLEASEAATKECNPRDSQVRGTSSYRREMVKVLVLRGLKKSLQGLRGLK